MIGALWILLFTAFVGLLLYLFELRYRRRNKTVVAVEKVPGSAAENEESGEGDDTGEPEESDGSDEECCGLHLVCEKDSLSPMSDEVVYYDDEELDRFIGRSPESYTPEETEEFRDVLMTLRPEDVAGWARSVTIRRLELPAEVRDELLMLVNEQRRQS